MWHLIWKSSTNFEVVNIWKTASWRIQLGSSKLHAVVLVSKNTASKTKASSKDKAIVFHEGNILITEKNTQVVFLNVHQPINKQI